MARASASSNGGGGEGHVLEGLDEDAAEPEHEVALHAEDGLDAPVTMGATRQPSIAASGWAAREAARISSTAVSAVARSATPKRTLPISLLWRMSAESTLRTTGKPRSAAASAASRAVRAGTVGTPAAARMTRAASSIACRGGTGR